MVRHFFGEVERAAWQGDEQAQEEASEKVKSWLAEFGSVKLLREYPYVRLRVNALAMHLFMGTHRLDDAWDVAVHVSELVHCVPMSEAGELCVSLALLGG